MILMKVVIIKINNNKNNNNYVNNRNIQQINEMKEMKEKPGLCGRKQQIKGNKLKNHIYFGIIHSDSGRLLVYLSADRD